MTVRDVTRQDLPAIAAMERECFSLPWTEDQLLSQLAPGHAFLLAENEEKEPVGYVGAQFVLDEGYISNVAVTASARRQGLADALLEELERRGRQHALSFLTLEVRRSNAPAISLYEKHGYTLRGERKNYYSLPTENALIYTKDL